MQLCADFLTCAALREYFRKLFLPSCEVSLQYLDACLVLSYSPVEHLDTRRTKMHPLQTSTLKPFCFNTTLAPQEAIAHIKPAGSITCTWWLSITAGKDGETAAVGKGRCATAKIAQRGLFAGVVGGRERCGKFRLSPVPVTAVSVFVYSCIRTVGAGAQASCCLFLPR